MIQKKYKKGDLIIKYGDLGKEYYVLLEGKVRVIVYEKDTNPNI
jgi:CRP-like cAMP-binding protein